MKNIKPTVLVSHPGRQHVHQLNFALQQKGYLKFFCASIWYKPGSSFIKWTRRLSGKIFRKLEGSLKKRYFAPLQETKIILFPFPEVLRQLLNIIINASDEKWVFKIERIHDRSVSRFVLKHPTDIVIGYEKSSLLTFRAAKQAGKITILDLAQVYFTHIAELRDRYPTFRNIMKSEQLFARINHIKQEEYKHADYILTLSSYARQTLTDAGIPAEKIFTVNLGFDPARFKQKAAYHTDKTFRVLFVGTITNRKGIHLLLSAFDQLQLPDAQLVIVGPMADAHEVLQQYKGRFQYLPFLHHEELVHQYQQADVFVFPSYLDSWAMTVIEAMACGTPVIVSENTGAKDAVRQGGGFVIPVDNVEAIKEKISFFYHNRHAVETMGREAHRIAQQYTWQRYYEQVAQVIDEIWVREHAADTVV